MSTDGTPAFALIGERLNTHREDLRVKVFERDKDYVIREARRQQKAGATHLDIHAGGSGPKELEEMLWILETILPVLKENVGIVVDSSSPECLSRALFRIQGRPNTIVNAITNDAERMRTVLPLAVQHGTGVIAILSHGPNPSRTADERLNAAEALRKAMVEAGIPDSKQYFDPQVLPLGFDPCQPKAVLETLREIKRRWPFVHTIVGLSNISFNVPGRSLLNRTFLAMLLASGIDGAILDPRDKTLRKTLLSARALLGQDDFLADYLANAE